MKFRFFTLILLSLICSSAVIAQTMPDFTFTDTNGEEHTLSETLAEGKVVFLDLFFVNCGVCNQLNPQVEELIADFEGTNVEFWALTPSDTDAEITSSIFNPSHSNHFASGTDGGGAAAIDLIDGSFSVLGYPTYSIICADGTVNWDVWPVSDGLPELRDLLSESCGVMSAPSASTDIESLNSMSIVPNPAQEAFRVDFSLSNSETLRLKLVNTLGATVRDLGQANYNAGMHTTSVDVADVPAGIYYLELTSETGVSTTKVMVSK